MKSGAKSVRVVVRVVVVAVPERERSLCTVGGLEDADANTVLLNQSELLTRNYQHPEAQAEPVAVVVAVAIAIAVTDAVAVVAASYC